MGMYRGCGSLAFLKEKKTSLATRDPCDRKLWCLQAQVRLLTSPSTFPIPKGGSYKHLQVRVLPRPIDGRVGELVKPTVVGTVIQQPASLLGFGEIVSVSLKFWGFWPWRLNSAFVLASHRGGKLGCLQELIFNQYHSVRIRKSPLGALKFGNLTSIDSSTVERRSHKAKVEGANPSPCNKISFPPRVLQTFSSLKPCWSPIAAIGPAL